MRNLLAALLIVSATAMGQSAPAQPSPSALFRQVRERLLADVNRQSRYTCVQNITRQMFRATSPEEQSCSALIAAFDSRKHDPPVASWDRLQLDVGIADNLEIHAWSGASHFSEDEVRRFVGGPFGAGDFANFITGVFGGSATVRVRGKHLLDGRTLYDYSYNVPLQASRYQIETESAPVFTAYGGSFILDPQTDDIVQLTVRTAELSENSTIACQARNQMEYGRLDINGHQVLIPRQTRLLVIDRNGREGLNTISYSGCHEYTSKSTLLFGEREPATKVASPAARSAEINSPSPFPEGLKFACRIVTPIDSNVAAAGSSLEAILRNPIRARNGTVLAPRGARIRARLVRLAKYTQALDYFEVGVHLESIEVNGADLPLHAMQDQSSILPIPGRALSGWNGTARSPDVPPPLPREAGVFFFIREHLQLRQFDSSWITASPETEKKQRAASLAETRQPARAPERVPEPAPAAPATTIAQAKAEPLPDKGAPTYAVSAPSAVVLDSAPANPKAAAPPEKPAPASGGTAIPAVLSRSLDAKKVKVGDKVEAKITQDSILPDKTALPRDSEILGHVSDVKASGKESPGSSVAITFDHVRLKDGRELPLRAMLQAIGRPFTMAPAAMDESMVSSASGIPGAGSASGASSPRGSPGPPPSEPPPVSNPNSGAPMPGEHNPEALNADSRGMVGFKGLSLSASATSSLITSEKGNVRLNSGTQLILRAQ
jgi:hypothetical protein